MRLTKNDQEQLADLYDSKILNKEEQKEEAQATEKDKENKEG